MCYMRIKLEKLFSLDGDNAIHIFSNDEMGTNGLILRSFKNTHIKYTKNVWNIT